MIPYWYLILACGVCLVAGFAAGSARLRGLQRVVERLDARLATLPQPQPTAVCAQGLAEAAETLAGASMQDTTMQLPVAANVESAIEAATTRPELIEALELQRDADTLVAQGMEPYRRDWADLHDVEPDEDGPGEDDQPPPSTGGGGMHVEVVAPRFQPPTPAERWPAYLGVLPSGWMTRAGWRLRTWWARLRREAAVLRQMEARGWEPGEATALVRPEAPKPRRRHLARRGTESWDDHSAALKARWYREREERAESLRGLLHKHAESGWSLVLPELRAALRPPQRTVIPMLPGLRCVP